MRKIKFSIISLLLALVLIACSSDEESEQANSEEETTNEEVNNNEEPDENQEEDMNEEPEEGSSTEENEMPEEESADEEYQYPKEDVLDRYPDALRLGEVGEFERNDITHDHVNITINSFKFVDELKGEKPENDHFLLANVTVENLLDDYNYEKMFVRAIAEGRNGGTEQDERDELSLEFNTEEPGVSTGDLVFDVQESDYYRISIFGNEYLIFTDEQSDSE